jgi:hypothetical protein
VGDRRRHGHARVRRRRLGALRRHDRLDAGHDLARENPKKLAELQRLWLIEAVKYDVVPLDDRFADRALPELAGRPTLIHGKKQLLFSGMGRLTESSVVMMKNTSFSLTAEIVVPDTGADGVPEHQVRMEFAYDGGGVGKGRRRHAPPRRRGGRLRPRRADRGVPVLGRRDVRRRRRARLAGDHRLRPHAVHRPEDRVNLAMGIQ